MLTKHFTLILAAHFLVATEARGQGCATPLLVVEQDGRISVGSKERLRSAVESGFPIRVGWSMDFDRDGSTDLAHWANAAFITEFQGEVFTQIAEIREQAARRSTTSVEMSAKPRRWTGLLGTNGYLEGVFDDDQPPTRLRVRSIWCVDPRVPRENVPASLGGRDRP